MSRVVETIVQWSRMGDFGFFAGRLLTEIKQIVDFARKPYEPSGAWIRTRFAFYKEKLSNLKSDYIR